MRPCGLEIARRKEPEGQGREIKNRSDAALERILRSGVQTKKIDSFVHFFIRPLAKVS
jgi:hypothetical protein